MLILPEYFDNLTGFDWDPGNMNKSLLKHRVARLEAEQLFYNRPILVTADVEHSSYEERYHALGRTDAGRLLNAAFVVRRNRIRIVSIRPQSRRERLIYGSQA